MSAPDDVVVRAARGYVDARVRLLGADGPSLMQRAVELDAAWHLLHTAVGVSVLDCGCEELDEIPYLEDTAEDVIDTKGRLNDEQG